MRLATYGWLTIGLLLLFQAHAEPPPFIGCESTGCIGRFGSIYVMHDGAVQITKPENMNTSALTCSLAGGQYFTLRRAHPGFKEIYALLLAAQVSGQALFIRAVESTSDCEIMYAVAYPN